MNLEGFTPRFPATLTEQITRYLTQAITSGRFDSGERLVEHELKRQFGVSRGPIREALRILEKNGLVTAKNGQAAEHQGVCVEMNQDNCFVWPRTLRDPPLWVKR